MGQDLETISQLTAENVEGAEKVETSPNIPKNVISSGAEKSKALAFRPLGFARGDRLRAFSFFVAPVAKGMEIPLQTQRSLCFLR